MRRRSAPAGLHHGAGLRDVARRPFQATQWSAPTAPRAPRWWLRRAVELHGELSAVAHTDLRWWILAAGVAAVEPWGRSGDYVSADATPTGDTFIGYPCPPPADPIADAIARARAVRTAIREIDGTLPDQPLASTLRTRTAGGRAETDQALHGADAVAVPSSLDVAAFAIGGHCAFGALDDPTLPDLLASVLAGATPPPWRGATPFVCVSIGDDPVATARHAHRRAWREGSGPWLGVGRAEGLATVSTCHLVVDGYGHARLAGRIAELIGAPTITARTAETSLPPLAPVDGAIPLGVAWRRLPGRAPRALAMAYALGRALHRDTGPADARFSPTMQIPVAPGDRDDPLRIRRRPIAGVASVRFDGDRPEPYEVFSTRTRAALAREAAGHGLTTRLLAAARALPIPLAWKRKSIGATRAPWLDRFAEVIGGRACLSKITVDARLPPSCAVSSPARLVSDSDPLGSCVITIVEDGERSAITACGSGLAGTPEAANAMIDELLDLVAD